MNRMLDEVETQLTDFRLDLAAQALYEFTWNEYCDWYLELSKATLQSEDPTVRAATRYTLLHVLETTLRAMHPIMPFITEEIWQRVRPALDIEGDSIMLQPFPRAGEIDTDAENGVAWLQAVIQGVRRIRSELNLPPAKRLDVVFQGGSDADRARQKQFQDALTSLARIQSAQWVGEDFETAQCGVSVVGDLKVLIPLMGLVDVDEELRRLNRQLQKETAELKKSEGKLGNSRFVDNAPEAVVEQERRRLNTHRANVENLNAQIAQMEALR
jgi:valyl-tRNA synthetase